MDNAIELKNVCKHYSGFELKNVSFNVPTGCIMGFVGENGAGKTTILKAILNLINIDNGQIKVLGEDSKSINNSLKEKIVVAFDDSYFGDTLCADDVSLIMKNTFKSWDDAVYQGYIQRFSLPHKKIFKEYSKGMKMKLTLAVALSHHAKLLILDEATSGLDPIVRDEILDIFLEFIQDEEHTILISSHIISDLEKVSDYITFINKGEVLFSKEKDELIYNYGIVKCSKEEADRIDKDLIVGIRESNFGCEVMVNDKNRLNMINSNIVVDNCNIEEIMLFSTRYKEVR